MIIMEKDVVIFRKEKSGTVIAVFPYMIFDPKLNMTCYAHIGQHSALSPEYYRETKPANADEYKPLMEELTGIGYNLEIRQRVDWEKYRQAAIELKKKV
jgi:hypothetical protein